MMQKNNLRQHVTLAIVTLILAAVLLALTFIPHAPVIEHFQGAPTGGYSGHIVGITISFSLRSHFIDTHSMHIQLI